MTNKTRTDAQKTPHVVIIGGGFAGLYAARALGGAPVRVTLIDKRNFHLFQPLLYQVATGMVSPGEICSPLRSVLHGQKNTVVLKSEAVDILPNQRKVVLTDGELGYDILIVATGLQNFYFGHEEWAAHAPGLKSLEDALEMRRRILLAFEEAERDATLEGQQAWLTFVVVGGGPTGVELAGALAELAHRTMKDDFRYIDPTRARILLLEGVERILPPYPPSLSAKAAQSLQNLGVIIWTNTLVTEVDEDSVTIRRGDETERIPTRTVLWAAGMRATPMGRIVAEHTSAQLDRMGRVIVEPDLSVPGHSNIFVIGDVAHAVQDGNPLPGVAPVAMQQGEYLAELLKKRLAGEDVSPFRYRDKGSLAVIGRNAAVARLWRFKFSGFLAWLLWALVHIAYLIEFDNKILVMIQWAWTHYLHVPPVGYRLTIPRSPSGVSASALVFARD